MVGTIRHNRLRCLEEGRLMLDEDGSVSVGWLSILDLGYNEDEYTHYEEREAHNFRIIQKRFLEGHLDEASNQIMQVLKT